jgi:RNA polymerase subunit RPABC4/transcription elongation factor Spt4
MTACPRCGRNIFENEVICSNCGAPAASTTTVAKSVVVDEREGSPFDPRTEVSADAKYISGRLVKHLWIIFVLLPLVAGLLLLAAGVIK